MQPRCSLCLCGGLTSILEHHHRDTEKHRDCTEKSVELFGEGQLRSLIRQDENRIGVRVGRGLSWSYRTTPTTPRMADSLKKNKPVVSEVLFVIHRYAVKLRDFREDVREITIR